MVIASCAIATARTAMTTAFHRLALGLACLAGTLSANAATVNLSSWTFGNGNEVRTQQPGYSDAAGGFSGTLDGATLTTYSVELSQDFDWGTSYRSYTDQTAVSYFGASSDKALKLARLVSYAFYDSVSHVSTAAQSTSMQLAIWNVVYDNDDTLTSGSFVDTSSYARYANTLLAGSQSYGSLANVWVLASRNQEDLLRWSKVSAGAPSNAGSVVPEPGSVALVLLALGAAGMAARRRA
jgi:hypothetical protein